MDASRRVAVIVVSWNRAEDLRRALAAILASSHRDLEVIVVDNGSTDGSPEVAAELPVRLIRNAQNRGFAEPHEQALQLTSADYIALVNNDALIAPDWIERLIDFLEQHPSAAAAGGKQYFWDAHNPPFERNNRYYAHTLVEDVHTRAVADAPDELREVATLSGSAVMIRRRAIDDVGAPFLDPIFFAYYEETDFFARAVRKGWKLYYTGEPACWHRVRASTTSEPYRYMYLMYRNRVIWAYRNFDDASLARVLREAKRGGEGEDGRARRDALQWIHDNRRLLEEHRARFFSGRGYLDLAREIQSRAHYYGYERPEVCALIPEAARHVIDFGCAAGGLGKRLKAARPHVQVRGVEPVIEQAERARAVLDDVMIGTAEDPLPAGWPSPDCIVFADVLEHLVDPWRIVRRARSLLAPGGALVVSVPNVLHHSVVSDLVRGRFDYRDAGVLDRTHLRFFTAATARELVEQGGFRIERMERVVDTQRFRSLAERTPANGKRTLRALIADACTVQYLIVAR